MVQRTFLTDLFDLVYLRFASNAQRVHLYSVNCSILDWNHLEKLVLLFLYNLHRKDSLLNKNKKKLSPKINMRKKNKLGSVLYSFGTFNLAITIWETQPFLG